MSFQSELRKAKTRSLDDAHFELVARTSLNAERYASSFSKRAMKLFADGNELSADEAVAASAEELDPQKFVRTLVGMYRSEFDMARSDYYLDAMNSIIKAAESALPGFMSIEHKPTRSELESLPETAFGRSFDSYFASVMFDAETRLSQIIALIYQPQEGAQAEARKDAIAQLDGALANIIRRCENIYRMMCQVVFEKAQSNFMGWLGG